MKNVIVGGFLLLSGVIGLSAMLGVASSDLTDTWNTLPGRLITAILENGTLIPSLVFLLLFLFGMGILGTEYFKNDR